ncbi:TetR/AcrR family transcriptional regulator [Svornostia abyssi]|uniref:TetR/AcrR family transcriptional regulator n=1 Tax=Svornostia abyssi TaxID=2898438 RepID=A0ABY5PJG0_9ACTN|nr:TetR/AcrR family transcriptional regulator [Parviterribacteraceae bacterium J379]
MATTADGRSARSERTRHAIIDALFALLEDGNLRPTTAEIADQAGVSERSVFQHFPNREALFTGVGERQAARVAQVVRTIDLTLPLPARIDAFVTQRAAVLELLTPTRRAGLLIADEHPAVARNIQEVQMRKRERALATFAQELDRLPASASAAVAAATSWSTWDALRDQQGLTVEEARSAVSSLLTGVLEISRE